LGFSAPSIHRTGCEVAKHIGVTDCANGHIYAVENLNRRNPDRMIRDSFSSLGLSGEYARKEKRGVATKCIEGKEVFAESRTRISTATAASPRSTAEWQCSRPNSQPQKRPAYIFLAYRHIDSDCAAGRSISCFAPNQKGDVYRGGDGLKKHRKNLLHAVYPKSRGTLKY